MYNDILPHEWNSWFERVTSHLFKNFEKIIFGVEVKSAKIAKFFSSKISRNNDSKIEKLYVPNEVELIPSIWDYNDYIIYLLIWLSQVELINMISAYYEQCNPYYFMWTWQPLFNTDL